MLETVWERTERKTSLSRSQGFRFAFSRFPAGLFFQHSETRGYFWSVSVGAVWDGCHHAARETGGTAAMPTSENSQAEGKKVGFLSTNG